jgi:hypothetical protein
MSVTIDKGFYDSTVDPHDPCGILMTIKDINERSRFLRAYINARLLFFPKIFLTDATINNSSVLRRLIFSKEKQFDFPCDYDKLIKDGSIVAIIRDNLPPEKFSSELTKRQSGNKYTDLPSKKYAKKIDELFNPQNNNIQKFELKEASKLFTDKIKEFLNNEYSARDSSINSDVNIVRLKLLNEIDYEQVVNLNGLFAKIDEHCHKESNINKIFKEEFSERYKYNIPELLELNYQRMVKPLFETPMYEQIFEYEIPQTYVFNYYSLANLPSEAITEARELPEYKNFYNELNKHQQDQTTDLIPTFEQYIKELDRFIQSKLTKAIKGKIDKEERIKISKHTLASLGPNVLTIGMRTGISIMSKMMDFPMFVPDIIIGSLGLLGAITIALANIKIANDFLEKKEKLSGEINEISQKPVIMPVK